MTNNEQRHVYQPSKHSQTHSLAHHKVLFRVVAYWYKHNTAQSKYWGKKKRHIEREIENLDGVSWMDGWMDGSSVLFSTKKVVVLLSISLFVLFLCLFLLMMLMEGISTSSNCSRCCNLLFYLVLVGMLWIFLCFMLLVLKYIIIRKKKKKL